MIQSVRLSVGELEEGWRAAARLYPWSPSMILWRGWEFAAYRKFTLPEPVLDIGSGDGRFFRLLFPDCKDVVGVELDPGTAHNAREAGVYRDVHVMAADALPANAERFASAFANCSLEHMDNLHDVLSGIHASLRPGAPFLCSVVTDHFTKWSPLPIVLEAAGAPAQARDAQRGHEAYHHLANPLSREEWCAAFERAGFVVEQQLPIVPELAARLFLFVDQVVHLPRGTGEWSEPLTEYLERFPAFPVEFPRVLSAIAAMERSCEDGAGLVAWLRRRD
jgi:SAM-dependent methyltransferase